MELPSGWNITPLCSTYCSEWIEGEGSISVGSFCVFTEQVAADWPTWYVGESGILFIATLEAEPYLFFY